MARIPLNTLPAFRTVARLQNLRAAAEQLHLTHSAVSQQIRLLEEQVGFALFDRRGRRIEINAAGAALLQSAERALDELDEGVRAAEALAAGAAHRIRITMLPSFAQRWFMPRVPSWRHRHPEITLDLHTSQQVVDLQREGFHVALRQGSGQWRGLDSERLIDSPLVVVGTPQSADRLRAGGVAALSQEPLLGHAETWERWFAQAGLRVRANPVAEFNDAGILLQAAEQGLGIALAREVLAADALRDGRLVKLSPLPLDLPPEGEAAKSNTYWLAYPPSLRDWPPLIALRAWLQDELSQSMVGRVAARSDAVSRPAGRSTAGRTGNRSPAKSAARSRSRA